jgi:predicted Fe-Mo cluster-binding NifX family protein
MKLCMPTTTNSGPDALICDHFGSAPAFVLYDPRTGSFESIENPKADHEHGQCRPMDLLVNRGIAAMVCKGMGRNAIAAVERSGIKVFSTRALTVRDAVGEFMEGKLVKLDPDTSCAGHNSH